MDFGLFLTSLGNVVLHPSVLLMVFIGVAGGITIGALPGLTATMGVALLVPFTFGRPPTESLAMLLGIYCGAMYGGSISAILIRTPGTPAAAATVLEGYPMGQKGQAGRALSMALFASFCGGTIGALIMTFLSPVVSRFALEFGPVEYFALALFGLSVIISISGDSVVKGVMSGMFGLLLATIGFDPISGFPRYTFGRVELLEGPAFIPTLIGLFAVSEILNSIEKMGVLKEIKASIDRYIPSWQDIKVSLKNIVKSSLIGTAIGSIPGAGGDIAAFVSYGEAKRSSKHPHLYGTGVIEGVAATEAANNACSGGAMIPLLSLGVPGDAVTAVLLGAFVIQGLQPGPLLYREHLDVVYNVFASMLVANVAMLLVGMAGIRFFARIILVKREILNPVIFVLSLVGSFAMRQNIFDVGLTLAFGVLGWIMMRAKFPLSPILLALILGPMTEANLRRALTISQGDYSILVSRPIAIALFVLAALSLVVGILNQRKIRKLLAESVEKGQEPG
ncbi:MAG TPA: tripartite tricarboxylate transporter permease [Spirochaetia bacterium]|nr:tripartite tricarboxylate transporter permease [Spirochaetales bacterium]HRY80322.1 tripartite tricarboxylate transporter permease [Spirochaetia bacterium]